MFSRICLILALLFVFTPVNAQALEVSDIRFGLHQDKTRLVLDMDSNVDFQAFVLADPYRMVVDLPQFSWAVEGGSSSPAAGVLDVRHGVLKPGISRIVFDLNRPVSIQSAFVLPRSGGKADRLVIDFANVPLSLFAKVKGKVHGTLNSGSAAGVSSGSPRTAGSVPKPVRKAKAQYKPLIILDPGHGGVDPGALGKATGLKEKDIVLKLSKALKKELEGTGRYRVKMTRESDKFIKLRDRVKFARKHKGDLFISIHADSIGNKHVHGASVYTLSEKASDKQTAKLAARENKADLIAGIDLSVEDQDVANILVDLARRDTMNQSKFFAGKLVKVMPGEGVKILERPHRYAGFAVLKAPDIPSILVEAGFMSNKQEAQRLNTPAYRMKVVRALRRGVDAYFEQVQKNQRE